MAIYDDGKHNENMEWIAPKFEVTDKAVYHTTHWCVETEKDTYYVQCQEVDLTYHSGEDVWFIESDEGGPIDTGTELGRKLIEVCREYKEEEIDG